MLININDDRFFAYNILCTSVQMIFLIEKPVSNSALLKGMIIDKEYRRFNLGNLRCSKVRKILSQEAKTFRYFKDYFNVLDH